VNTITWFNYADTDPSVIFNVYRSIPGFEFLFSALSANPNFRFAATSPDVQEVIVSTTNIDAAVTSLNAARGIKATKTSDNLSIQVRLTAQSSARLKMYKCTLLEDLNIASGTIIVPGMNFKLLGPVAYDVDAEPYAFEDDDGSYLDMYHITSTFAGEESIPSIEASPLLTGINYCVAEARFIDIQGRPVHGVEMIAEPALLDGGRLSTNKIKVISDAYGRVSVPLIQGQQYVLHIPAIGYNQFINVPLDANFLDITQWPATQGPEFSP